MDQRKIDTFEFFIGCVPPRSIFNVDLSHLNQIVDKSEDISIGNNSLSNTIAEICLIGLASYFEAFCKSQFAAIVNICPETIKKNFLESRPDVSISLKDLLKISSTIDFSLGSLLAEKYDFGSAKMINGLYFDLLRITPFTVDEANRYSDFLGDRNLLVHHKGIYTLKYHGQRLDKQPVWGNVHAHSLVVLKKDFKAWTDFLWEMAEKIAKSTHDALIAFVNRENIQLREEQEKALEYILWD